MQMSFSRSWRRFRWRLRRAVRFVSGAFDAVGEQMLRLTGWLLFLLFGASMIVVFTEAWLNQTIPEPAAVGWLLLLLLVSAALIQLGPALSDRLKKVGPVEFHAAQARSVIPELGDTLERIMPIGAMGWKVSDEPVPLAPDERYYLEKADGIVRHLERNRADIASSRVLQQLISKVATIALDQGEHAKAIDRFRLLIEGTDGLYKPENTWLSLATAQFLLSASLPGSPHTGSRASSSDDSLSVLRRRALLVKALDSVREAIRATAGIDGAAHFRAMFLRAEILHFLGETRAALEAYKAVLNQDPGYAPAKYNRAALLSSSGQILEAWEQLMQLQESDTEVEEAITGLESDDPELQPLREDPRYSSSLEELRKKLR